MFHWFGTINNARGQALAGWQVGLVVVDTQDTVDIFSDESATPIVAVSGVANRAVADENGNYDFYVPSGTYSLQFFNASGVFQRSQRYLPMYGEDLALGAAVATKTGATYTLADADENTVLVLSNASAITLTVPDKFGANIAVGSFVEVIQGGAGAVSIIPGGGATINTRAGLTTTAGQWAVAGLRKIGVDAWVLTGDLV